MIFASLWLLVAAAPVSEVDPPLNCDNPRYQIEMTMCAGKEYEAADVALNAQWKRTAAAMKERDKGIDRKHDSQPTHHATLLAAQRAWLTYRDQHCLSESFSARGGSMAPMLYSSTIAHLTEQRTEILRGHMVGLDGEDKVPEPAPAPPPQPPVRRAEPVPGVPSPPTVREPSGAKSQALASQQFFDAYKAHDRTAAQSVAAETALKKLVWKASAGSNPTLKLMDNTHIYYEGGSIELKMQKNSAGRWFIADVSLYAD